MGNKHSTGGGDGGRLCPQVLVDEVRRGKQTRGSKEPMPQPLNMWGVVEPNTVEFYHRLIKSEIAIFRYMLKKYAFKGVPIRLAFADVTDAQQCVALANTFNDATAASRWFRRRGWDRPIHGSLKPVKYRDDTRRSAPADTRRSWARRRLTCP